MKYLWTEDTGAGLHFWVIAGTRIVVCLNIRIALDVVSQRLKMEVRR